MRETGLEPVRDYHTPLKRARLPIPPLSQVLIYYNTEKRFCQHIFSNFFKNFFVLFIETYKSNNNELIHTLCIEFFSVNAIMITAIKNYNFGRALWK